MKSLHIHPATTEDIPDLASLRGGGDRLEKTMLAYLQGDYFPSHAKNLRTVLVATLDNVFAGYTAGHQTDRFGCHGELQWLNVKPEFQRQGVGRKLVAAQLNWFTDQGLTKVCVNVDPSNEAARQLYLRHGATELNDHWLVWNDVQASRNIPPG